MSQSAFDPGLPDRAAGAPMTCEDCVEFLLDYVDGVLSAAERARFEAHLGICRDCVVYLENYKKAAALVAGTGERPTASSGADVPEAMIRAILRAREEKR